MVGSSMESAFRSASIRGRTACNIHPATCLQLTLQAVLVIACRSSRSAPTWWVVY